MWIEFDHQNAAQMERLVLITALGVLSGLRDGRWEPDDAEAILFKPAVLDALQEAGASAPVLEFIQQGFFLDDVLLLPGVDAFRMKVIQMEKLAMELLQTRPDHLKQKRDEN